MAVHQKLRKLRQDINLSQQNIADMLHISQNAYSLIESGKTKIDEERIFQLAQILNVPPVKLLADDAVSSNAYERQENASSFQRLNAYNIELTSKLSMQLAKKDEQIEKLMMHIEKLLQVIGLGKE